MNLQLLCIYFYINIFDASTFSLLLVIQCHVFCLLLYNDIIPFQNWIKYWFWKKKSKLQKWMKWGCWHQWWHRNKKGLDWKWIYIYMTFSGINKRLERKPDGNSNYMHSWLRFNPWDGEMATNKYVKWILSSIRW